MCRIWCSIKAATPKIGIWTKDNAIPKLVDIIKTLYSSTRSVVRLNGTIFLRHSTSPQVSIRVVFLQPTFLTPPQTEDSTNHRQTTGYAGRSPCLLITARGNVLIQMQQFSVITDTQFAIQTQVTQQLNCTELLMRFLHSIYAGHVGMVTVRPWWSMPKWQDGATVEFIMFLVQNIASA